MSAPAKSLSDLSPEKRALLAMRARGQGDPASRLLASEPVAIIGMACRFPGGADTPAAFWELLRDGVDAIREVPPERWDVDAFYDADPAAPGKMATRYGGFIDGVDQFDPAFFGVAPREAAQMDPQQRILLELSCEALERAGLPLESLAGSRTGVFMGVYHSDYAQAQFGAAATPDNYLMVGFSIIANRLSYLLDLQGPSVAVDTACSSSLVALHLACQALRGGECGLALAGGVNLILSPQLNVTFSKWGMLAPDGRCKTFDAAADGYVRGEGAGVVALKRLSDALSDGDPILALVVGSAINQDGRTTRLTAPNGLAQQAVIRQALASAGVAPEQVGYVEAHGTGTALGDPIEIEALAATVGQPRQGGRPCLVGAVKANVGHLEAAAGMAGLIKAILALEHQAVPPQVHFRQLNPHITLEGTPLAIPTALTPWPRGEERRYAGVSAFGAGGTNAHIVLCEATRRPAPEPPPERAELLPIASRSPEALRDLARAYAATLASDGAPALHDICYTAAARRSHHDERLALVGRTHAELAAALTAWLDGAAPPALHRGRRTPGRRPGLVFVFPGQGGQWAGMGRDLLASEPAFAEAIGRCAEAFAPHVDWSLPELLGAGELPERIDVVQPALFAVQVALAALWRSWGVTPDAVIGHSMGEVAAAHVAGALSLADAARVICRRSQLLRTVSGQGAMAVVGLPLAQSQAALGDLADRLAVAVSNSPQSTVISGDAAALESLLDELRARNVFCRPVKVDVASHSPQVDGLLPALAEALDGLRPGPAATPVYSTVTGAPADGRAFDAAYWARNLREPVLFGTAVQAALDGGHALFVELSPHPTLLQPIEQSLAQAGAAGAALPSLRRGEDSRAALLEAGAGLYAQGYPLPWRKLYGGGQCVPLPGYPWQRRRYWTDYAPAAAPPVGHPLLGEPVQPAGQPGTHLWQRSLALAALPYVADQRDQGRAVLPGAAVIELALAGAAQALGPGWRTVEQLTVGPPMPLPDSRAQPVQLELVEGDAGTASLTLFWRPAGQQGGWERHASGTLRAGVPGQPPAPLDPAAVRARCGAEMDGPAWYAHMAHCGLDYGPAVQGVVQVWRGDGEALARVRPPAGLDARGYLLHPALLDACLQTLAACAPGGAAHRIESVARLSLLGDLAGELWSYARLHADGGGAALRGDILVCDAAGRPLLVAEGLRAAPVGQQAGDDVLDRWLYALEWREQDPAAVPAPADASGRWLILADGAGVGEALAAALTERGAECLLARPGPAFAQPAPGRYELRPESGEDADQLLAALGPRCRLVVHLWGLDAAPLGEDSAALGQIVGGDMFGALALTQALGRVTWDTPPRLWLATRGAQALGAAPLALGAAPLWGFGRALAAEHPLFRPALVDLDPAEPPDAAALLETLLLDRADDQLALRGGRRMVARLAPLADVSSAAGDMSDEHALEIDPAGSYLITGGLAGLGLATAGWLVARGARHLALLARSAPSPESEAAIDELRRAGARVLALQADVSQPQQLAEAIAAVERELPPLSGVIHSAGLLDDGVLSQQTPARFAAVLAPKVAGAWHLHRLTARHPLRHFVLFSSLASLLGSAGQANHAAANAFLDALAHHRRALGLPALSINWGPWGEVGAVAQPERQARLLAQGFAIMSLAQGLAALERLWPLPVAQAGVLPVRWPAFARQFAAGSPPLLAELVAPPEAVAGAFGQELRDAAPEARRALAVAFIQRQLAGVLGFDSVAPVDPRRGFFAMGLDSLTALELKNRVQAGLGQALALRATAVFDYPTAEALAEHIVAGLTPPAPAPDDRQIARLLEQAAQLSTDDLLRMLAGAEGESGSTAQGSR